MNEFEKTAPEKIWLGELTDEVDMEFQADDGDTCWCGEPVFDLNVEYVRADLFAAVTAERDDALQQAKRLRTAIRRFLATDRKEIALGALRLSRALDATTTPAEE